MGQELQGEESGIEEVLEVQTTQTEEIVEDTTEEVKEDETVEDSARAALKELQTQKEQPDGDEDEEAPEPSQAPPTKTAKNTKPEAGLELEDVEPPTGLTASEKTLFTKLPNEFKPAVARMFKEQRGKFTRTQQELAAHMQEARHITEAVRPYYVSHPELAQNGITESSLVAALIGAHQKLTDPKTDRQEIERIAKSRGYNIKFVGEDGSEQPSEHVAIDNHPTFRALQEELHGLKAELNKQSLDARVTPLLAEIQQVQQEKDNSGRLLYPELSNPAFISSVKHLVSERRGQHPELSLGEALKQEVWEYRKSLGYSPSSSQTKLPVGNVNNRAVSAAVSARGRVAPQVSSVSADSSVPVNETPEQSARIALEELRRGIN